MDDDVARIRRQQHTGNHDTPGAETHAGTRDGAENVEPVAHRDDHATGATLIVTRDDALDWPRGPDSYADALAAKLRPYGVTIRFEPRRAGRGALIGVGDPKLEVDIRQAIATMISEAE